MADMTIDLTGVLTPAQLAGALNEAIDLAAYGGQRTLLAFDNGVEAFIGTPDDLEVIRLYEH